MLPAQVNRPHSRPMPVPLAGTEAAICGGRIAGLVASGLVRRPATITYVADTRLQRPSTPAALFASLQSPKPGFSKCKSAGARRIGHDLSNVSNGNSTISVLIRDGALHRSIANLFQGGKFLGRKPRSAMGKAWFGFQFCHSDLLERLLLGDDWLARTNKSSRRVYRPAARATHTPQHAGDILQEKERSNSANVIFRTASPCGSPPRYVVVSAGPGYKPHRLALSLSGKFYSRLSFFNAATQKPGQHHRDRVPTCAVCAALGQASPSPGPFFWPVRLS